MKKNILLLLAFIATVNSFAQTNEQRIQIKSKTNVTALNVLSEQFKNDSEQKKLIAEQWAIAHNLPISGVKPNGQEFSVSEYNSIEGLKYYGTNNLTAAKTISTNKLWVGNSSGLNLGGSQIEISMWDGGIVCANHPEYSGRVSQGLFETPAPTVSTHATHVAGTMIARGINAASVGMAPLATLKFYNLQSYESEVSQEAASGSLLSNHSWNSIYQPWFDLGSGNFGWNVLGFSEEPHYGLYTTYSKNEDLIANNAPFHLMIRSAGNERNFGPAIGASHYHYNTSTGNWDPGYFDIHRDVYGTTIYDCIPEHATAKNILVVGAVNDIPNGYTIPGDVNLISISSTGPTDDGRIKPDLVANGSGVYSTYNNLYNCLPANLSYGNFEGTSQSAASVTGSCALLQEHYSRTHSGTFMFSSTLKALLIETADEAGLNPGPDYQFGWGLMNTKKASELISLDEFQTEKIQELTISNGQTIDIPINLATTNNCYLSATIAWNDPAGTPPVYSVDPATLMLVNDLDMRIIDPTNGVRFPWALAPTVPGNPAAQYADNFRDNVEQVRVYNAPPGNYILRITHKATLSASQNFSLVINSTPDMDLYVKDQPEDVGVEPNPINGTMWVSDDIWVRNQPDGLANPCENKEIICEHDHSNSTSFDELC